MFNVVLYQPEIPPNTGNIIRLCANTGSQLHLVEPLGFELDEARVRRAGLDYHELTNVTRYADWQTFQKSNADMRLWAFSSHASKPYDQASFQLGDGLLFGPETRGLPQQMIEAMDAGQVLKLPMRKVSRSLNLSNTVAVAIYEALRQTGFKNLE